MCNPCHCLFSLKLVNLKISECKVIVHDVEVECSCEADGSAMDTDHSNVSSAMNTINKRLLTFCVSVLKSFLCHFKNYYNSVTSELESVN